MNALPILDDDPCALVRTTGLQRQLWQMDAKPEPFESRHRGSPRLKLYLFKRQGALVNELPGRAMVSFRRSHGS